MTTGAQLAPGKSLELEIVQLYRQMNVKKIEHDIELSGNQIDRYIEIETADKSTIRIAIEAKDYGKAVGIEEINKFKEVVNLLRNEDIIDLGIIVTSSNFTRPKKCYFFTIHSTYTY